MVLCQAAPKKEHGGAGAKGVGVIAVAMSMTCIRCPGKSLITFVHKCRQKSGVHMTAIQDRAQGMDVI